MAHTNSLFAVYSNIDLIKMEIEKSLFDILVKDFNIPDTNWTASVYRQYDDDSLRQYISLLLARLQKTGEMKDTDVINNPAFAGLIVPSDITMDAQVTSDAVLSFMKSLSKYYKPDIEALRDTNAVAVMKQEVKELRAEFAGLSSVIRCLQTVDESIHFGMTEQAIMRVTASKRVDGRRIFVRDTELINFEHKDDDCTTIILHDTILLLNSIALSWETHTWKSQAMLPVR